MSDRFRFRAWWKEKKVLTEVDSLDFNTGGNIVIRYLDEFCALDEEDVILMQSIGLRDKHGTLIYESDIVKLSRPRTENCNYIWTGVIKFESGCFWFMGDGLHENCWFHYNQSNIEILGNIYEHPTLIKEKS